MTMSDSLNQKELKTFIAFKNPARFEHYTHDALTPYVQYIGADTCLRIACIAGQFELVKILAEDFDADIRQTRTISSDRHAGQQMQISLLDDVLDSYATDNLDRDSSVTRAGFANTFQYLLQNGAPVQLNEDPLESPILMAHLLACPDMLKQRDLPHFDLAAGTYLEEGGAAFKKPYQDLYDLCPKEMNTYLQALDAEQKKLKAQFAQSQQEQSVTTPTPVRDHLPPRTGLHKDLN